MGNLTTTGLTSYPTTLDTSTTLIDGASGDQIIAENVNGPTQAVIALETELGTLPKGSAADVKTRLATALNSLGAVTLATLASTVGMLPFARGGVGETVASTTNTTNGFFLGFANGVLQPLTLSFAGGGLTVAATSGTWTVATTTATGAKYQVGSFTYDTTSASGSVTNITTTNFVPKLFLFNGNITATTGYKFYGGQDDGTNPVCIESNDASVNLQWASVSGYSLAAGSSAGATDQRGRITTLSGVGGTITWTKNGAPTGTLNVNWVAFG